MASKDAIPGLERITGPVAWPGSVEYEDARRTFNATVDRRPAVIVQPDLLFLSAAIAVCGSSTKLRTSSLNQW